MMVLKKFHHDGTQKIAKYTHFICQELKCPEKVKNTLY